MFKKIKNKKSVAPIQNNTMTDTLPDPNTLNTQTVSLADTATGNTKQMGVTDHTNMIDKTFLPQENNSQTSPMPDEAEKPEMLEVPKTDKRHLSSVPEGMDIKNEDTTNNNTTNKEPPSLNQEAATAVEEDSKPVKIKLTGRMLNFTRLHITGDDFEHIKLQLNRKFAQQPNSQLLVVISCEEKLDLSALLTHLWGLNLQPIGIVTGQMDEQAKQQHLAIFPADGKRIDVLTDDKNSRKLKPTTLETIKTTDTSQILSEKSTDSHTSIPSTKTEQTAEKAESYVSSLPQTSHLEGDLIYTTMLRSGQSINHVGGDLVLTQGINAGAEAITDYSLHVYGKAEGRLVAGATGDENARVFCLRFNPSLVSVAGTFCLRENIPSEFLDKAVQVSYERDKGLVFKLMNG